MTGTCREVHDTPRHVPVTKARARKSLFDRALELPSLVSGTCRALVHTS